MTKTAEEIQISQNDSVRLFVRSIALIICLLAAPRAVAWNDCGHMLVAAIAYPQLTATTKQHVDVLLQRNPHYEDWIRGVEPTERSRTAFIKAATWADTIKRDEAYDSKPERGATPIRNVGYSDTLQHRQWHYINLPFTTDNTALPAATAPNLKTQIAALRYALQSPRTNTDTRSYSLVWLLHLVGDAHQPLHATSRFSHEYPRGDQGGNAVILCEHTCNQNLHELWDRALGTTRKMQSIIRIAASFAPADPHRAAIIDETVWLHESAEISQRQIYTDPVGKAESSITLTKNYKISARDIARKQASIAGARLANTLNILLGQ
jgi:hypothetical protein